MKEVEVFIGIILIVLGAIVFEMNWNVLSAFFGLVLLTVGVFSYILAVESLDKTEDKKRKKKERFLPLE